MLGISRAAKYAVPLGITFLSPAVVLAEGKEGDTVAPKLTRKPWDVYCDPPNARKDKCQPKENPGGSDLERCVQKCREDFVGPVKSEVSGVASEVTAYFNTASSAVCDQIKYLQKDASNEIKGVAIAGGSILGMLFAIRKSFFKKLLYAAAFGSGTAAMIYPKEAKVIVKEGYLLSRTFFKDTFDAILPNEENKKK